MTQPDVVIGTVETSIGTFGAAVTARGLCRLTFPAEPFAVCDAFARKWLPDAPRVGDDGRLQRVRHELAAYFAGDLRAFTIPLDMYGTPFQQEVWAALLAVPFGETRSYGEIAAAIRRPKAVRAVGAANGANPVPIVVPCHRIIGSNGKLTGYAGGLDLKLLLLEREGLPETAGSLLWHPPD